MIDTAALAESITRDLQYAAPAARAVSPTARAAIAGAIRRAPDRELDALENGHRMARMIIAAAESAPSQLGYNNAVARLETTRRAMMRTLREIGAPLAFAQGGSVIVLETR